MVKNFSGIRTKGSDVALGEVLIATVEVVERAHLKIE